MRAGDLRHRITIQVAARSQNSMGEWIDTWSDLDTVWAAVEPLAGKRYFEAKQANADVTGIVRLRYRTGLQPTMRLKYGDRILQIVSIVHPKERGNETHIYYKEALD